MNIREAGLELDAPADEEEQIGGVRSLLRLGVMLKPFLPMLGVIFLLTSCIAGISIVIPKVAGEMVDNALRSGSFYDLNRISLYLVGLIAAMALLRYFSSYHLGRVGAKFLLKLRRKVFNHLIYLSLNFYERRQTGELNARLMANLEQIQNLLTDYVLTGVQSVLQLIGVVAFLLYINVELTLIAIGACVPLIVLTLLFGNKLEQSHLKQNDALAGTAANVEEVLSGISTVQAFGKERHEIARYGKLMETLFRTQMVTTKRESAYMSLTEFFGFSAIAVVLWFGGQLILSNELSVGDLTACLIYMFMFGLAVQDMGELYTNYSELKGVSHRVFEILDEQPTIEDRGTLVLDRSRPVHVEFDNVTFSYASDPGKSVLKGISLGLDEGDEVAIVGPSGSGKTTIFKLLMRFYEPNSGQVRINGEPLSAYQLGELRGLFGLVSQDIFLFSGTVLENVCYGSENVSVDDVEKAVESIGATDFIASLKHGLYEQIGVGGSRLSGGQKQLLGIVRIYLRSPSILLLDEATSSLDSESERKVQESLKRLKKDRTTIVIAHRLATVSESKRIVLLENGHLLAEGDHSYLTRNSDLYRKFWQWQSRSGEQAVVEELALENAS